MKKIYKTLSVLLMTIMLWSIVSVAVLAEETTMIVEMPPSVEVVDSAEEDEHVEVNERIISMDGLEDSFDQPTEPVDVANDDAANEIALMEDSTIWKEEINETETIEVDYGRETNTFPEEFSINTQERTAPAIDGSANDVTEAIITEDTIWDNTTESYELSGTIRIKNGATLEIKDGVTVNGNGCAIYVYGSLIVNGATINNTVIGVANTNSLPATIDIENSIVTGGSLFHGIDPQNNGNTHANITIKDNKFKGLDGYCYIWYPSGITYITGNVFDQCGGLSIGSNYDVYVTNNVFYGMTTDYSVESWAQYYSMCYVENNSFFDAGIVLRVKYDGKMTATNNYWNTDNAEYISSRISDGNTNLSVSEIIEYIPFLTEPHESTPIVDYQVNENEYSNNTSEVKDFITKDTVWDNTTEPYELSGIIRIKNGATLEIKDGVTVNGNGCAIYVYGSLIVNGATINNTVIGVANTDSLPATIDIENSIVTGGSLFYGTDPQNNGNKHANITIKDNKFKGLDGYCYIWYPSGITYITGNVFDQCGGLRIGSNYDVYVTNNVFHGMTTDYSVESWAQYYSMCYVENNSFFDAGIVLRVKSDGKMTATNNYWNTDNAEYISSRISDGNTNFSVSEIIEYIPFLTEPHESTPIIAHSYETIVRLPSCSEDGRKETICTVCGDRIIEDILATGHQWEEAYTIEKNPTCIEEGIESIHCANCDAKKDSKTIPATGHSSVIDEAVAATCTESGLTEGSHCSVCGTILKAQDVLPSLGHDYQDVVTAPTCTEQGFTTYTCSRCGDSYIDNYMDALGHDWDSGVVTSAATCTENGLMTYTCSNCGDTRIMIVDALGHAYSDTVTPPTCTEKGYTTHTCSRCGNSYVDTYVDAIGHNYIGMITKESTCTAEGVKTYSCSKCGSTKTEAIDALGHDLQKVEAVPSTKDSEGNVEYWECGMCGSLFADAKGQKEITLDDTILPKLGDVTGNGVTDLADLLAMAQYLGGKDVEVNTAAADVNGDGSTDYEDLIALVKMVKGALPPESASLLKTDEPYAAALVLQEAVGLR